MRAIVEILLHHDLLKRIELRLQLGDVALQTVDLGRRVVERLSNPGLGAWIRTGRGPDDREREEEETQKAHGRGQSGR